MAEKRAFLPTIGDKLEKRQVLSHAGIAGPTALLHHALGHHAHGHHDVVNPHHFPGTPSQPGPVASAPLGFVLPPSSPVVVIPPFTPAPTPPAFVPTPDPTPVVAAATPPAVDFTPTPAPAAAPAPPSDPAPQSLSLGSMTSAQFNSLFQPIATAPAMASDFHSSAGTGSLQSEVFQGTGAASGLYAYAYQFDVQSATGQGTGLPGASWRFNDAPVSTNLTGSGPSIRALVIADGSVGDIAAPHAAPGQTLVVPTALNWGADGASSALLTASFGTTGAQPGAASATLVVLSHQPPTQQVVNLAGGNPIGLNSSLTLTYAPELGALMTTSAHTAG